MNLSKADQSYNVKMTAGVDEVGRGPLAGPVVAAAVILDPGKPIPMLKDSKKLSERQRDKLSEQIKCEAIAWSISRAEVEEIDSLNILYASLLAMKRAIESLQIVPHEVLVDGNKCPDINLPVTAIIKGDEKIACISAASIIAKVSRDNVMREMDKIYQGYGFADHKGYPTRFHISALDKLGVCPIHRRSFKPVRDLLDGNR